jgi:hypothetical protein
MKRGKRRKKAKGNLSTERGGFGGDGVFYEEVKKAGHWPDYLFVGRATPWPGYSQVSRTVKKYDVPARAIYRRNRSEKSSHNPRKVGRGYV